ncbi:DNA polymerase III subunit beta [Candidatus Daviesbacteria bacterium]|nr:DNA polymerase III subunit beta [Candidatus Daviesbacteria bacterium]
MKFSILQQDLLPALQAAARSAGARTSLPVLENILLSLEGENLKIAATNLEIGVMKFIAVKKTSPGELTIPAKLLLEVVAGLGPVEVELESNNEILTVASGRFKATLNGIAAAEFPAIPLGDGKGINLPKEVLLGCGQILFAAAVDEGRPVLTGVLTEIKEEKIDFVATDGFRLAHRQVKLALSDGERSRTRAEGFKSLIPRRTFEELLRVIGEDEAETVSISPSQNQNQIVFSVGKTVVSSRLIEGSFPAWEKIIPGQIVTRALVDKEELVRALKLAAVFGRNEANIVVLSSGENKLTLASSVKEIGSQENEVEAQIEGDSLQVAFNTRFLQDAVSASPASQLMIEFSGVLQPALIKPMGEEGLEYIVMPVRLS